MSRPRLPLAAWLVAAVALLLAVTAAGETSDQQTADAQYADTEEDTGDDENNCAAHHFSRHKVGVTNSILTWTGVTVDYVIRPALLNRVTAICSLLVIFVLHLLRLFRETDYPGTHTFLVHLFVLNLFYSKRSLSVYFSRYTHYQKCPFIFSAIFLILDSIVRGVIASRAGNKNETRRRQDEPKVVNRYMQVGAPFSKAQLYFLGQFSLMMIFVYELDRDKEMAKACNVSFFKWFVASILTILAGQSEVGQEYDPKFWQQLFEKEEAEKEGFVFCCFKAKNRHIWKVRHAYSFIVNNIFRMLILGLCPIMLCVSDSMEFIKDCLAVFFITKLDDVDGGSTLTKEVEFLMEESKKNFDMLESNAGGEAGAIDRTKTAELSPFLDSPASREDP